MVRCRVTPSRCSYLALKRQAHQLKPIKGTERKNNWLFFDTETKSIKKTKDVDRQSLHLGFAQHYRYDKKNSLQSTCHFTTCDQIGHYINSCVRSNSILNIMSMNLAFDFTICKLAQYLKNHGWELKTMLIESRVVILKYRKDKMSIVFVDLFNYVKASVKKIGDLVGLPKLDVDFKEVSDKDLLTYCIRDVEIIARMMEYYMRFVYDNDLGCLGMTTPSQAFNAFRHRFMKHEIFIHNFKSVSELERRSYFGGRTECFFIGKLNHKVHDPDVNSMYPYVMREFNYPTKLIKTDMNDPKLEDVLALMDNHIVIADVYLHTDEPVYPIKRNDKTIFPIGTFTATLAHASLKYAFEHGHVKKILNYACYESAPIFKDYIDCFYSMRLSYRDQGNNVFQELCKLFLNSLYGKFGQRCKEIKPEGKWIRDETGVIEVYNEAGKRIASRIILAGQSFLVFTKEEEGFNSFVAIASCVTDYARVHLWKLMKAAGRENVFYCDTDSLFVNSKGLRNLQPFMHKSELGKLNAPNHFKWLKINGLKDYESDTKKTLKGIKKNAVQLDKLTFEQLQFPTMKGVIRKGMTGYIDIKSIQKTLTRQYNKGIVSPSGKVSPFDLREFLS